MATYTKKAFAEDLAKTVRKLVKRGTLDPSAEEICRAHYKTDKDIPLGAGMIEDVRARLKAIKKMLIEDGFTVVLLRTQYYDHCDEIRRLRAAGFDQSHDDWPIKLTEDAVRCVAIGQGCYADGLYLPTQPDDVILLASKQVFGAQSTGRLRQHLAELQTAADAALLSDAATLRVLNDVRNELREDAGALVDRLIPQTLDD